MWKVFLDRSLFGSADKPATRGRSTKVLSKTYAGAVHKARKKLKPTRPLQTDYNTGGYKGVTVELLALGTPTT